MGHTQVWDIDEEPLLRHFCLKEECAEVIKWFKDASYERPEDFRERLNLAKSLRELSNNRIKESAVQEGMMLALGSLHCLDFNKGQSTLQTEEQKNEVVEATVPLLSNLSLVFLKRNDAHNCVRAANLGLTLADRLKEKPASLQAKLLYRRGLGRSQAKDFSDALKDFVESARLLPEDREIRRTLDECKARAKEQNDRSDDTWRGAMSDSPKVKVPLTDRFLITLRRWLRATKRRARQAVAKNAETFLTIGIISLAPLCACVFGLLLKLLQRP
ncbi:Putative rRNA-processing protein EBP2-like [Durusdinium trenchii]|uniref:peptidylprolyl isomerase n=1 Tax=Durusdinium trenchii TaxID=1381693 RepID=A0ABP0K8N4_9DINO